ncbi:MAG: Glu/Leu/Phe/Val dehydrogenase family protein, partial [Planctomycetota bacterium]
GKSVIFGDSRSQKTPDLFRAMGRFVQSMEGRYITAEDVGTSVADMNWVREETQFVTGRAREDGGSGDPSPYTAYGCFLGVKALVEDAFDGRSLEGVKVAIQGVGHVGIYLGQRLRDAGCELIVCDINREKVEAAAKELNASVCDPDQVYSLDVDVYAPCALGATVNDKTLPQFKCKVIAGAANNVLHEDRHGDALREMGIRYAPDYVINAGGIINVSEEFAEGGYVEPKALTKIEGIYDTLKEILKISDEENISTAFAADRLAERVLEEARAAKAQG